MYCNNCGYLLGEGSTFCASCGAPVVPAQAQPEAQQIFAPVTQPEQSAQPRQPFVQQVPPQGYHQPNPYQNAPYGMGGFSQNNALILNFLEEAKKLRTLGIVATVLMFGIGFIFSIIILVKKGKLVEPVLYNPTPAEVAELEKAKKVLNTAKILAYVPFIALALSFVAGFVQGLIGAM